MECWNKIAEVLNRRVAIGIFICLNGLSTERFTQYFKRHQQGIDPRENNSILVLPPIRTETGKRFQRAQIFNILPIDIRDGGGSLVRFEHECSFTMDCNGTFLNTVLNLT